MRMLHQEWEFSKGFVSLVNEQQAEKFIPVDEVSYVEKRMECVFNLQKLSFFKMVEGYACGRTAGEHFDGANNFL